PPRPTLSPYTTLFRSRERFTMDEHSSRAVREAFVRLYEERLLYRAERLINWCVRDGTALSDLEVDHEEAVKSELYKFAYPLADGSGEIVVATTRPETMLGDTAIAVHPEDERYKAMIGRNVRHPITGREFPIIADAELVDPKFGTGAVKVTPAHSFEDFESGRRHRLQFINILDWCISRQLWWGHQIPAWYCDSGHVTVAREQPAQCGECRSSRLRQDPDVLDTWFSSGLWPFSTFGWPDQTPALKTFYPNSVMETGFDILFFWVARMAMLCVHFMGQVPFSVVFSP